MDSSGLLHRGYWFFVLADTPHCRRSLELFLLWRVLGELGPAVEVGRDGWLLVLLLSGRAWRRVGWGCGGGIGWCFVSSLLRAGYHRRCSLAHGVWVFLSGRWSRVDKYWNGRALSGEEGTSRGGLGSPHRGTHHVKTWPTISNNQTKTRKKDFGKHISWIRRPWTEF